MAIKQNLYLEIFSNQNIDANNDDENEILVTLETCIALFIFQYLDQPSSVHVHLIQTNRCMTNEPAIKLNRNALNFTVRLASEFKLDIASNCNFPVIVSDESTVVAGLCAVMRTIIKNADQSNLPLLGFKEACLLSPSEASTWTKYCEIDIVNAAKEVLMFHQDLSSDKSKELKFDLPNSFSCFESHLQQPIRVHNIYKLARDKAKQTNTTQTIDNAKLINSKFDKLSINEETNKNLRKNLRKPTISSSVPLADLNIEHSYAEGQKLTVADIILFPQFWLALTQIERCAKNLMNQFLPLTLKWFNTMKNYEKIETCLKMFKPISTVENIPCVNYAVENIESFSLYKRENRSYKPKHMIFTHQKEIEESLDKIHQLNIDVRSIPNENGENTTITFDALLDDSNLPEKRVKRKNHQLISLAIEIIKIANDGDRIVDFCSGTGHLGIILASKLPKCQIFLIENKEESLRRAKERVNHLQLANVTFFQCNLDYFVGDFEIGTSLHACGTATDIVLKRCIDRKAKFVCCPCCYGKCEPMPHISYPRSEFFRSNDISPLDFIRFAHCADQSHDFNKTINIDKSIQGQFCMDVVDTDRNMHATECGYITKLTRLFPENCTPKNRLLIGII